MIRLAFFIRTAINNLRRGGQRVLVAVLCVAFGVMSLVAMTLLSDALGRMFVAEPHDLIGADISMDRAAEAAILPEHIQKLETLRQASVLKEFTLVAYTSSLAYHLPQSGELFFPGAGIGIDPGAYPPIGSLSVESLSNVGLPTLLEEIGDVLISRDLALEHKLKVGDSLVLTELTSGAPLQARIRGIITDTPNHKGSKLYYSLNTAQRLAGASSSINTVLATADDLVAAQDALEENGWRVFVAPDLAESEAYVQTMFTMMLNGSGVLGLLVGGVGIANTMQVLLRRRRREIAIWKMIGYRNGDLLLLFSLEAGLLGLIGSVLGAVVGIGISVGLVDLFSRTSTMLIRWAVSPAPVLLAVLVGVTTNVVFALWAIVRSSQVRPLALLRDDLSATEHIPWFKGLALLLALGLPFAAVISLVMGSLLKGVGILLIAAIGLVSLGGGLGTLLWLTTHLLPLRAAPLLNMARNNLRQRGASPVFALVALFIGVVALTSAIVVTQNANRVMDTAETTLEGSNLLILAPASDAGIVQQAVAAQPLENQSMGYQTRVRTIHRADDPEDRLSPVLISWSSEPDGFLISGAAWGSQEGVYTANMMMVPVGSILEIIGWDGSVHTLPVIGTYQVDFEKLFLPELGVLLTAELSQKIISPDQVQLSVRVPPARLQAAAHDLGEALPGATVVNLLSYALRFTRAYHNLFLLAVSMASLALLAGILLMANSVSLAMLDRRYEIGVLKAMGYARRHVLITLMVEYGMMAMISCGAGLLLVRVFVWFVGLQNQLAGNLLQLSPLAAGVVALLTLGLTLLTVLAVTWKPTLVSPLVVLNDRE